MDKELNIVEEVLDFLLEHPFNKQTIALMGMYLEREPRSIKGAMEILEGEGILIKRKPKGISGKLGFGTPTFELNKNNEYASERLQKMLDEEED